MYYLYSSCIFIFVIVTFINFASRRCVHSILRTKYSYFKLLMFRVKNGQSQIAWCQSNMLFKGRKSAVKASDDGRNQTFYSLLYLTLWFYIWCVYSLAYNNISPELPTFRVIAGVNRTEEQWYKLKSNGTVFSWTIQLLFEKRQS